MLKFKLAEDGKSIAMDPNGQPIVIDDANPEKLREFSVDAIHLYTQIPKLKEDIVAANKGASEAKLKLEQFAGIEDVEAAKKALETVSSLKEGDLKKASDVEAKILNLDKENVAKLNVQKVAHDTLVAEKDVVIDGLNGDLNKAVLGQAFAQSAWFNGKEPKSKLGPTVGESFLGKYFKVERLADGRVMEVGYIDGKRLEDPAKGLIGDAVHPMIFDDAMQKIVEVHPQANDILWPSSGSGSHGSKGGHQTGGTILDNPSAEEFGKNLADIASGKTTVNQS